MDVSTCQKCGAPSAVAETRGARRRRECSACAWRWSTYEVTSERLRELEAAEARLKSLSDLLREPLDDLVTVPGPLDIDLP